MTVRSLALASIVSLSFSSVGFAALQDAATMLNESQVAFSGTVAHLSSTSFPPAQLAKSENTIVVHVDSVLKKSASLPLKAGQLVTVQVKDPNEFKEGMQATFFTNGWLLGSSAEIAVIEIGHSLGGGPDQTATASASAPLKATGPSDLELMAQLNKADAVVVGRVTDVHPVGAGAFAATAGQHSPITEHNPDWQEAVIQVQDAIKGTQAKTLVVRFPASRDVAWYNTPKFQKGQSGTFLLKSDQAGGEHALVGGVQPAAFTALPNTSILPATDASRVRALMNDPFGGQQVRQR